MADQTLAQDGALAAPRQSYDWLPGKLGGALRVSRCWARFIAAGANPSLPHLVDFIVRNRVFWAMQQPNELASLGEILSTLRPSRALEIGTARGGTLLFLTRLATPKATIVSVDKPNGRFGGGYGTTRRWFYQRFARGKQKLHLLQGDSHSPEMLSRVKAAFSGQPLDYLFIDGDHRYEGVKSDFEMYGPMVRTGGVIAFHDISNGPTEYAGGAPQFWHEVRSRYRHTEIINDAQHAGWGIGVLHV